MTEIGLLGVPANSSGRVNGVARAPGALRAAGLVETLRTWHDTRDYGDLALPQPRPDRDPVSHVIDPPYLAAMIRATSESVRQIVQEGRFPVVVGGDCPLLIGCLDAFDERPLGLLFVDGHEDAFPPDRSPTGEAADMELGWALGRTPITWDEDLASRGPWAATASTVLLGPRDAEDILDNDTATLADVLTLIDDRKLQADPRHHARAAAERLAAHDGGFWLHVDLDVLSAMALAAVDYPQEGGLSWDELIGVMQEALETRAVRGLSVTIYNPDLDPEGTQATLVVDRLAEALSALP